VRVALPHGRRDPGRAAGVAATHACADRRASAATGHRSRLRCRRRPGRRDGRCAPRYGRLRVVPQPRALDRISRRPWRVYAHAIERMRAPGRDAAFPVGAEDAAARVAAREPVARVARASWSRGRLSARASSPFPAVIAHPASMAGFNVSPSVTATVFSPRCEARLSESDCYRIAAILSARPHAFGVPPHRSSPEERRAGKKGRI
jgi:hypothetical protein